MSAGKQKMSTLCGNCNKIVNVNRQSLNCSCCKKNFHVLCTDISEKRYNSFYATNKEQKNKWMCNLCHKKKGKAFDTSSPARTNANTLLPSTSNLSQNNITTRKKCVANVTTENSFQSLDTDDEEETNNCSISLNRSCPVLGHTDLEDLTKMRNLIFDLQAKLVAADHEISNLLEENGTLKKQIQNYEQKVDCLNRICKSVPKKRDSINNLNETPKQVHDSSSVLCTDQDECSSTGNSSQHKKD